MINEFYTYTREAEEMIGQRIRDDQGRVWRVAYRDSKDGEATVSDGTFWCYASQAVPLADERHGPDR